MNKLYYCNECKRVISSEKTCDYCNSGDIRELSPKTPVNVIGSKIKGRIFKINNEKVTLVIRNEGNDKYLKEYEVEQLRKIL